MILDEVFGSLQAYEQRLLEKTTVKTVEEALQSQVRWNSNIKNLILKVIKEDLTLEDIKEKDLLIKQNINVTMVDILDICFMNFQNQATRR